MNLQRYEVQPIYREFAVKHVSAKELGSNPYHYEGEFKEGDVVQHFKGGLYVIKGFALHTEGNDMLVIYQSLKDGKVWARPYNMFASSIDLERYPDATQPWRFIKVKVIPVSELEE